MYSVDIPENEVSKKKEISMLQSLWNYFNWSREQQESRTLCNLTVALLILIVCTILRGSLTSDIQFVILGIQNIMHLLAHIFSLFALLKAKTASNLHFTYGFTRYETLAAFSKCVFLALAALFLVMNSIHLFSHHEGENKVETSNSPHNIYPDSRLSVWYAKSLLDLIGMFAFSGYAFFAPPETLNNGCSIRSEQLRGFTAKFGKLQRMLARSTTEENTVLVGSPSNQLQFSSHSENMHSVFLHFFIDLLFNMANLLTPHLVSRNWIIAALGLPLVIFGLTIMFTKKLFITCFKILLQALPIEDDLELRLLIQQVANLEGVENVLQHHFWGLSSAYLLCNIHVRIRSNAHPELVHIAIHSLLDKKFHNVSLQLEHSKTHQ